MRSLFSSFLALSLAFAALPAAASELAKAPSAAPAATCEHGVSKALCTRCKPKLAPVFKAKGDWCPEHARPESQCALCHPDLKKKGVKE